MFCFNEMISQKQTFSLFFLPVRKELSATVPAVIRFSLSLSSVFSGLFLRFFFSFPAVTFLCPGCDCVIVFPFLRYHTLSFSPDCALKRSSLPFSFLFSLIFPFLAPGYRETPPSATSTSLSLRMLHAAIIFPDLSIFSFLITYSVFSP